MEPGEILVGLKLIINTDEFDEVIFSLHQDPKIWEKVSEDNFLEDFSKLHGNEPDSVESRLNRPLFHLQRFPE